MSLTRPIGAAAAAAAAAALTPAAACGGLTPGPLDPPNAHYAVTARQVGVAFTDGLETIAVPRDAQTLTLISVEAVGDPGLEIVGWKVADDRRRIGGVQFMPWPPRHELLPAESIHRGPGYTTRVRPRLLESGLELLIGVRPTTTGYLERRGLDITYEVDGERHRTFFDAGLYVCSESDPVPRSRITDCPDPEETGRDPHFGSDD